MSDKKRKCGPKVKTGCQTCKIRRVKCDESKPTCKRCSSTGRKCDGYLSDLDRLEDGKALQTIPRISKYTIHIPGNPAEKRGFQYFLKNTAVELSGYYDESFSFWGHLLLQASSSEPSLRHAVIAIGSLHEDFSKQTLKYTSGSQFANKQYTKAISALRRSLSTGTHSPLTALMSCILFVCFDSLRGHFTGAMVHLQSGLKILRDLRERRAVDKMIEDTIVPIFMRLSLQSILYVDTRGNGDRQAFAIELMLCGKDQGVPEFFESLEEARNCMHQAVDGLFRMLYMCDGELPCCFQPIEAFNLYDTYSVQLREWNVVFEKFMNAKSQTFDSKQIRGAALMKIHYETVRIMSETAKPDYEDTRSIAATVNSPGRYEQFKGAFRNVVNLSRSLISAAEVDSQQGRASLTFSADLGVVAPLYYAATHCTDTVIRQESMALLSRCPRREGMWDGEAISRMIHEFWQIEETHKSLQQAAAEQDELIPLSEMIDLEMHDGMIWEWKWKDPAASVDRSRTSTPVFRDDWASHFITPGSAENVTGLSESPEPSSINQVTMKFD